MNSLDQDQEGGVRAAPGAVSPEAMAAAATEAARAMRMLSNPSRLMILCVLGDGERSVGEIEQALGLGQPYVSQQLARLRDEGLVAARRDGRQMNYSIADTRIAPLIRTLYEQYCPRPRP